MSHNYKTNLYSVDSQCFNSHSPYRFGFNGQEKDDEVAGAGNTNTAVFWEYDTRLGRRWNIDPVVKHNESGYACFANNPILYIDSDGQIFVHYTNVKDKAGKKVQVKITFDGEVVKMYNKATGQEMDYNNQSSFVSQMVESYKYIVNNGADIDGAMEDVAKSKKEVEVRERRNKGSYLNGVIEFDFSKPLDIFDNNGNLIGNQSPALAFWSEVYHACIDLINLDIKDKIYNKEKNGGLSDRDALYQIEEPYVHEIVEPLVIYLLKESNPDINEAKRESYEKVWPSKGTVDVPTNVK